MVDWHSSHILYVLCNVHKDAEEAEVQHASYADTNVAHLEAVICKKRHYTAETFSAFSGQSYAGNMKCTKALQAMILMQVLLG